MNAWRSIPFQIRFRLLVCTYDGCTPMGRTCRYANEIGGIAHPCLYYRVLYEYALRQREGLGHVPGATRAVQQPTRGRQYDLGSGNIFQVGIFLDFVRLTTRTMHPHGAHVRGARRNRIDPHGGGIERLVTRTR